MCSRTFVSARRCRVALSCSASSSVRSGAAPTPAMNSLSMLQRPSSARVHSSRAVLPRSCKCTQPKRCPTLQARAAKARAPAAYTGGHKLTSVRHADELRSHMCQEVRPGALGSLECVRCRRTPQAPKLKQSPPRRRGLGLLRPSPAAQQGATPEATRCERRLSCVCCDRGTAIVYCSTCFCIGTENLPQPCASQRLTCTASCSNNMAALPCTLHETRSSVLVLELT
jgi:hypothetical protein